jgi:DNA repair protein RadD
MIALLRATKSVALYVQICGRGMRTAQEKQNCLVLDFGGNILRHGPIDCIHVKAKGKKGKKAEIKKMPVKECPACGSVQSIRVFECSCGYQFPLNTTKLSAVPDTAAILSEPEILDVTWHAYKVHNKPGKPPSFKIEYGSGSRVFYDFLCFEHGGFASDMARKKWMRLCGTTPPVTTIDAVRKSSELPKPGQIKVKKEGEYWRVLEVIADLTPEFDSVKEIGINI